MMLAVACIVGMRLQTPLTASAHSLRVDKAIGVTMHISPDDEPASGTISQIMIDIQDKEGRFAAQAAECICAVTVLQDGVVIDTVPFAVSAQTAMISYTFKTSGVYALEVSGSPRSPDAFQSFRTSFSYHVKGSPISQENEVITKPNPLKKYLPFVVISSAVLLVMVYTWPSGKKKREGKK